MTTGKKILISGCSGFLGTWLTELIKQEGIGEEIYGFTEIPGFSSTGLTVYNVDITDRDDVLAVVDKTRPDLIFHLAAVANVGFSWRNQKLTYDINFTGTSSLMEAMVKYTPAARIVLMSSAELYGNCKEEACTESTPLAPPRNPYSLSKMAMEMLTGIYRESENLDAVTVRAFNFTGPGQSPQFVASDFSRQIAEIEKGTREPVIRVGNLSAVRDISDVRDIARFTRMIAEKADSGSVFNLCSGNAFAIRELLDMLLALSKEKIRVEVDEDKLRPVDVPVLKGDASLIRKQFGLVPEYGIKQTLSDLLDYWRNRVK